MTKVQGNKPFDQITYMLPNPISCSKASYVHQINVIYIFHYCIDSETYLQSSFIFWKVALIAKELGFFHF
jgi:hypothetical protein